MADLDVAVTLSGRDAGLSSITGSAAASLQKLRDAAEQSGGILDRLWGSMQTGAGLAAGFRVFEMLGSALGAAKDAAIGFNQTLDGARATMARYFTDTQSVNNSIASLNDLAAKTPFAFEGLLIAQQRTIGAARSAEELKSNMDAISVVAANTGRVSSANMERISLALGQVQTKGHLAGGEMLQLTEAGVNMTEILTAHFGVTGAQLQKMIEGGKVTAQDVFAAMREYAADPKNRTALDTLAKTWEGAWSTISDVGTTAIAAVFRPFFDLMTEGAVRIADFLQSDNFKVWAQAVTLGFAAASDALKSFLSFLAPLGSAISTAFGQLTSGDFSGAFATLTAGFQTQLGAIWESVTAFASSMLGAGENVVGEFASGIMQGAGAALQTAVDFVANVIASFLVGQSPPPAGPLSTIDAAGTKLMETYGQGMQQGLGPSKAAVDQLSDAIRGITSEINALDIQHTDLKNQIDDVKRAYEDQVSPLKEQLRIIQEKADAGKAEAELAFKIQDVRLKQMELEAKGDPIRRAEIAGQMELLKQKQQELGLEDSLASIDKERAKLADDGNKSQLEDLKYHREREAILQRIQDGKKNHKDVEGPESQLRELDLRHKMAEEQKVTDAEEAKRKLAQLELRKQELGLQGDLNGLTDKGKLAEIAKEKELLDANKSQFEIEQATKDIATAQAKADIKSQIDAATAAEKERLRPLQDQSTEIERQKQGLQEQVKALQLQKSEMSELLAQQKAAETAAKKAPGPVVPGAPAGGIHFDLDPVQKEAEDRIKQSGAHLAESFSNGFSEWVRGNFWTIAIGAMGAIGGANIGATIGAALGSVVPIFGTAIGGLIGGAIGAAIGALSVTTLANMVSTKFQEIVGAPLGEVTAATIAELRATFVEQGWGGLVTQILALLSGAIPSLVAKLTGWASALLDWVRPAAQQLMNALSGVIQSVLAWVTTNAGPIGDKLYAWSLALVRWAQTGGLELLNKLAGLMSDVLSWIGNQTIIIATKLLEWATAFVAWVGPKIPELLGALRDMGIAMVEWMAIHLGDLLDALGKWAVEFVAWVGPKIPPLLAELGKLLVALVEWIATDALPTMVATLLKWGAALIEWVGPRIGPLLLELGKLYIEIEKWILFTALPAIILQLGKWALAFIEWIAPMIIDLGVELVKIGLAVANWIGEQVQPGNPNSLPVKLGLWAAAFLEWIAIEVVPKLAEKLAAIILAIGGWVDEKIVDVQNLLVKIGTAVLDGIKTGISNALSGFWEWLKANLVDKIPETIRKILNLDADTGEMAMVGERLIQEMEIGIKNRWPSLADLMKRLTSGVGGDVDDWIKAAISITGVGDSWFEGMKRLVGWESSGDPTNVNPTEVLGQHASGLVQMLPSTFEAYRLKDLPDDIFNPISNTVASIRYIQDTYDTVYRIPGIEDNDHGAFPGYREGGVAWHKQLAWVGEDEPEVIAPISKIRSAQPVASGTGIDYDRLAKAITDNLPPTVQVNGGIGADEAAEKIARVQRRAAFLRGPRRQ